MAAPFVLLQLSDPHVGADWGGANPLARLRAAVSRVLELPDAPDAVLLSGDLTDNGRPEEYAAVRAEVERIGAPLHALAGNHDRRAALRAEFGLAGEPDDPIEYAADLGPLRLVVADTTVPEEIPGRLDAGALERLDARLATAPSQPTVLAMHHPPLPTGIPGWDAINLSAAERAALGEVIAAHPQVLATLGGHLHRTIASALGGRPVLAVASVFVQLEPEFGSGEAPSGDDGNVQPPAFAVHVLRDDELSSQVEAYPA